MERPCLACLPLAARPLRMNCPRWVHPSPIALAARKWWWCRAGSFNHGLTRERGRTLSDRGTNPQGDHRQAFWRSAASKSPVASMRHSSRQQDTRPVIPAGYGLVPCIRTLKASRFAIPVTSREMIILWLASHGLTRKPTPRGFRPKPIRTIACSAKPSGNMRPAQAPRRPLSPVMRR